MPPTFSFSIVFNWYTQSLIIMETQPKQTNASVTAGSHNTPWINSAQPNPYKPLAENLETDVVILGGGLGGVSAAYCLTKAGLKVVLVEDGYIGSGETGRTTAHLVNALDDRYYQLEKNLGRNKTRLVAKSHTEAISFIERVVKEERIDCDFERVKGYLFLHPSDKPESFQKELEATQHVGLKVHKVDEAPGMLAKTEALCFEGQAQFHPIKYMEGLCKYITSNGGKIFTNTQATEFDSEGIKTKDGFTVKAKHIVVATNSPVNNLVKMHLKQYAYRTYVIGAVIPKGSLPKAEWWDTGDYDVNPDLPPYHYIRISSFNAEQDLLIVGGQDHPIGNTADEQVKEEDRYAIIENWARQHFAFGEVIYKWSGQVLEPIDGIAFLGRNPGNKNIYIITGDSGNGMTHCTIGATLITDLIQGKENPYEHLYSPSRLKFTELYLMFKETMKGLLASIKNTPDKEEAKTLSEIPAGIGKIIKLDKETVGAYRDEDGHMHLVSAKCTHLGCSVSWNNDEKSWDCACHGSRFTYDGVVLNGPAIYNLPYHKQEKE
jgi:glycine/D-amino acid oxidase-like deaminating enzyme/nitrite reductase/ring-hydroxylating ferredoxin subunit